jgi:hypothetical protein
MSRGSLHTARVALALLVLAPLASAPAQGPGGRLQATGTDSLTAPQAALADTLAGTADPAAPDTALAGPAAPQAALADTTGAAADTLAAAPADTLLPPARDFFDTGIDGTTAVLMSPVFPGWGQLYAGGGWRAMLAFGAQWYFWSNMLRHDRQAVRYRRFEVSLEPGTARDRYNFLAEESWERMRDYAWWSGGILLLVALDAYVGAGLYGFDTEPLPVPDRFDEFFDEDTPRPPGAVAPQLVLWQWGGRF